MISLLLAVFVFALCIVFPRGILYFLLSLIVITGLAPRSFMENVFKTSLGPVTIAPLDVLLACMAVSFIIFAGKRAAQTGKIISETRETRIVSRMVLAYLVMYFIKGIVGIFEGVPFQTVIRMLSGGAQSLFFFLPMIALRNERQTRFFFYCLLAVALLFPIGQVFSAGSFEAKHVVAQDGTLRLGYGDACVLLAFPIIAIFAWNRKLALSAIPLAGLVMLSHRSAFLGIAVALIAVAFLTGRRIKATVATVVVVTVAGLTLFILQQTTSLPLLEKGMARIGDTFEATATTKARASAWPQVLSVGTESPITGVSLMKLLEFQNIVATYDWAGPMTQKQVVAFNVLHAHNFTLTEFVYTGVVGATLLFSIILFSLIHSWRVTRTAGYRALGSFFVGCILFFTIFALMNTTMVSAGYLFWVLIGVLYWYIDRIAYQSRRHVSTTDSKTTIAASHKRHEMPVTSGSGKS